MAACEATIVATITMGVKDKDGVQRVKGLHIGAPACFALEAAMVQVNAAFGVYCSYVVGSALERHDWRDVDVRLILDDDAFAREFPGAELHHWEFHAKWLLLMVAISKHLQHVTGLPVDFQIQPRTHANERHKGQRNAVGFRWQEATNPATSREEVSTVEHAVTTSASEA